MKECPGQSLGGEEAGQRPCGRAFLASSRSNKEGGEQGKGEGGMLLEQERGPHPTKLAGHGEGLTARVMGTLGVLGAEEAWDVIYTLKDLSGGLWKIKRDAAAEVLSMKPSTQQHLQLLPFSIIKKMGLRGEGIVRGLGMDMYTLLYLKWITTDKDLLYTTGNSVQYYMAASTGREFVREWIDVYVWLDPCAVHLKLPHF